MWFAGVNSGGSHGVALSISLYQSSKANRIREEKKAVQEDCRPDLIDECPTYEKDQSVRREYVAQFCI